MTHAMRSFELWFFGQCPGGEGHGAPSREQPRRGECRACGASFFADVHERLELLEYVLMALTTNVTARLAPAGAGSMSDEFHSLSDAVEVARSVLCHVQPSEYRLVRLALDAVVTALTMVPRVPGSGEDAVCRIGAVAAVSEVLDDLFPDAVAEQPWSGSPADHRLALRPAAPERESASAVDSQSAPGEPVIGIMRIRTQVELEQQLEVVTLERDELRRRLRYAGVGALHARNARSATD